MVIETVMRFLSCRVYDKKDKKSGEKTGEKGMILQLAEINNDNDFIVNTYFPTEEQIKTKGGINSIKLFDKVKVIFELISASSKPRFVALGDIVEVAHIVYSPTEEDIKKQVEQEKAKKAS